ncbi:hypothetical protein [Hyalangium sp.]|uniref:hypothetical protein n=1 Tax=Hyalangium sp. TaxID=2028555 RepID=UPI002D684517|nr:hypothetical protein [Hyalangium sp.]HYH97908.1 hypothetical protein [Hyalangium sp.]
MKRLPLLTLSLVGMLSVGCSKPIEGDAPTPTEQRQVKKRTQALGGVTLQEVPVSAAVLAAAEGQVTVRVFQIGASEEALSLGAVLAAAHQQGASDPVSLPWELGLERDHEETHLALKYLNELVPTIEAEVGTGEEYHSGSYHWFRMTTPEFCNHGEFHGLYFEQAGLMVVIEDEGGAEC